MLISDNMPNFKWKASSNDFPQLEIDFGYDSYPDIALLKRDQSIFTNELEGTNDENECISSGYLLHRPEVPVTVIGCPFNDTFQVNNNIYNLNHPNNIQNAHRNAS